jgi:hypothetical protein
LRELNLGKTNPRVSLHYSLAICFAPSLADFIIFLMLTRLVVVIIFENFSFALFTPPLGDFQNCPAIWPDLLVMYLDCPALYANGPNGSFRVCVVRGGSGAGLVIRF